MPEKKGFDHSSAGRVAGFVSIRHSGGSSGVSSLIRDENRLFSV
jgi:hypothetical protein